MRKYYWGFGIGLLLLGGGISHQTEAAQAITPAAAQQAIKKSTHRDIGLADLDKLINPDNYSVAEFGDELYKLAFERDAFSIPASDDTTPPDFMAMQADHQWFDHHPDTVILTQQSTDGLTLSARFIRNGNANKTAIIAHGYRGTSQDAAFWAKMYYDMGYNILAPDARAHGASQGDIISYGWKEKQDYQGWIQQMIATTGQDTNIILQGVSMGAATVMMTGGQELPDNVKAIIEDAGYTSLSAEIDYLTKEFKPFTAIGSDQTLAEIQGMQRLNAGIQYASDKLVKQAGMSIDEISTIKQVQKTTLPTLFIHGGNDDFVPTAMVNTLYDASNASLKRKVIIPNATHGFSMAFDRAAYYQAVKDFLMQTDKLALQKAIDEAQAVKPAKHHHYTAASQQHLQAALVNAKAVLANVQATQKQVVDSTSQLNTAVQSLVQIDTTTLENAISHANQVKPNSGYTFSFQTATQLKAQLKHATVVLADLTASQADVDQAAADLQAAIQNLQQIKDEPSVNTDELLALIKYATRLQNDPEKTYTVASFNQLKAALNQAKITINFQDVTQVTIDTAYTQLSQAIERLVLNKTLNPETTFKSDHKQPVPNKQAQVLPKTGFNVAADGGLALIGLGLMLGSYTVYRKRRQV